MSAARQPLEDTRRQLLEAAAGVFAEFGYHRSSTREICRRAGANVAAIHYHFGDKAELYRAVFREPFVTEPPQDGLAALFSPLGRREKLQALYRFWLLPLAGDARIQRLLRLRAREEAEPSGILGDVWVQHVLPRHQQLTAFLAAETGAPGVDAEVERLSFAVVGMGISVYHMREIIGVCAPTLINGPDSLPQMAERLAGFADLLISDEAARRRRLNEEILV